MKISGAGGAAPAAIGQGGKRAPQGGFAMAGAEDAAAPTALARTLGVSALNSVDALVALQQVDEPMARRKRAINRAGRLLDALDKVKLALLGEELRPGDLQRLTNAVREERAQTDDPGLEDLLDQIETRAAVELAKIEVGLKAA